MKFKGVTIERLKPRDLQKASRFAQNIINSLTIYNKRARTAFSKEVSPNSLRREFRHGIIFVIRNKMVKYWDFQSISPQIQE
jgi:hypothetical protein